MDNRRITVKEIADDVGLSFGSRQTIFANALGTKRASAKIVLQFLNFDHKQWHMDITQKLLNITTNNTDLLKNEVTGGKSEVYGYDIETKAKSFQLKTSEEPWPKNTRQIQ